MRNHPKTAAIIPSAGKGRRLGFKKKPFLLLDGRPILAHTLLAFEKCRLIDAIFVAVAKKDMELCRKNIIEKYGFKKVKTILAGGKERQDSVRLGLDAMGNRFNAVVIHDGARPLVTAKLISDTVNAAYEYGSAITAVPLKDTVKEVSKGRVKKTIDRNTLRLAQTPQAFKCRILKKACEKAKKDGFIATDKSTLIERLGRKVAIVCGSYENIKITTKEDLRFAGCILRGRKKRKSP